MFSYIANLLTAMLLGSLIGAERQWHQHMASLCTTVLVAIFYSISPASPGRVAAQVFSRVGFLSAGVIMQNMRGLNTAETYSNFFLGRE